VIDILQWEISRPCPLLPVCLVCYCIYGGPMLPVSLHRRQENESGVRILFPPLQPFLFRSFFLRYRLRKLNEKHHNYQERGRKPWVPGVCRCRPCPVGHGLDKPRDTPLTTRRYELLSATLANTDKTRCMSTMDPRSWDNRRWNQAAEPSSPLTTFARHHGNITYPTRHCGRHT